MSRPIILVGWWPRRMCADLAATYCGEPNTDTFLKRVKIRRPNDIILRFYRRDGYAKAVLAWGLRHA
jgi:hypothetical protein